MTSFCSQRGEGVKKGQKIAVILNVWPLGITVGKPRGHETRKGIKEHLDNSRNHKVFDI